MPPVNGIQIAAHLGVSWATFTLPFRGKQSLQMTSKFK